MRRADVEAEPQRDQEAVAMISSLCGRADVGPSRLVRRVIWVPHSCHLED